MREPLSRSLLASFRCRMLLVVDYSHLPVITTVHDPAPLRLAEPRDDDPHNYDTMCAAIDSLPCDAARWIALRCVDEFILCIAGQLELVLDSKDPAVRASEVAWVWAVKTCRGPDAQIDRARGAYGIIWRRVRAVLAFVPGEFT